MKKSVSICKRFFCRTTTGKLAKSMKEKSFDSKRTLLQNMQKMIKMLLSMKSSSLKSRYCSRRLKIYTREKRTFK